MRNIKLKATQEVNKPKLIDTDNNMVVTKQKGRWAKGQGIKYMVTKGDLSLSIEHTMWYADDILKNFILENCLILWLNVTAINLIKKFKEEKSYYKN